MLALYSFVILAIAADVQGSYDSYLNDLVARHADYHLAAAVEDADRWNQKLEALQSQHGVQDGQPAAQFPETYWRELVQQLDDSDPEVPAEDEDQQQQQYPAAIEEDERDYPATELDQQQQYVGGDYEPKQTNYDNGEHKVSGGAGEGLQQLGPEGQFVNKQESKTDKLPSYCSPPNPCPQGFDPRIFDSPCDNDIINSKAFNRAYIWQKMAVGECSCDVDHMRHCPRRSEGPEERVPTKRSGNQIGNPWLTGASALDTVQKKTGPVLPKPDM